MAAWARLVLGHRRLVVGRRQRVEAGGHGVSASGCTAPPAPASSPPSAASAGPPSPRSPAAAPAVGPQHVPRRYDKYPTDPDVESHHTHLRVCIRLHIKAADETQNRHRSCIQRRVDSQLRTAAQLRLVQLTSQRCTVKIALSAFSLKQNLYRLNLVILKGKDFLILKKLCLFSVSDKTSRIHSTFRSAPCCPRAG